MSTRADLLAAMPALKWLVRRRWFQLVLVLPMLVATALFLTAGVFGSPVGNRNGLIVFVWILWWVLLIAVLVPFASRAWCAACPVPFFGEWLQRRTLTGVRAVDPKVTKEGPGRLIGRNRYFGLSRRWPRKLSNLWIQNLGFLVLGTFSVLLLTRPLASAVAIGGLVVAATAVHLVYRQRTFCRYLCPVGGFLSLYSMASTVAVRSKDAAVCVSCRDKGCLAGNQHAWGCPWQQYPSRMERNNSCGLCMECVKACPHDNMTLFARMPFSDRRLEGYDEAWKAFIMAALALAYSAVYLGPWGALKDLANVFGTGNWTGFFAYAGALWALALVGVPGLFLGAAGLGRRLAGSDVPRKEWALAVAYTLVPFGLLAWIAFTVPLALANGSYVVTALSDPFGWGWNLFGTADLAWTPIVPHWTPAIQVALVLTGQLLGLRAGYGHALRLFGEPRRAVAAFAPGAVVLTGLALLFLRLYAG